MLRASISWLDPMGGAVLDWFRTYRPRVMRGRPVDWAIERLRGTQRAIFARTGDSYARGCNREQFAWSEWHGT